MLSGLINQFNNLRKKKYLDNSLPVVNGKYAFVGVGMHSLSTLYPILQHLNVPLKWIVTKSSRHTPILRLFPGAKLSHSIQDITDDAEIKGVFVCASAESHYTIIKTLAQAGKHIFVEKPPCTTAAELNELISVTGSVICKTGLQRRHWPANRLLLKKSAAATHYNYRFLCGSYPQGDIFTELFIHPLDYIHFLFGPYQVQSFSTHGEKSVTSVQAHIKHQGGVSGLLELSANHTWNQITEELHITTKDELLQVKYPMQLAGTKKPKRVLNIPTERILQQPTAFMEYFSASHLILPSIETNSLVLQGFYHELREFISLVENTSAAGVVKNELGALQPTYQAIELFKQP